ncbi:MAG: UPF0104 family protein [Deltaproteobacteria bacterium]|nr:MAG: UPF0104 family protein [Deltaproteobacteria bacterium]
MKFAINLALSLAMLAACLWFVWPNADQAAQLRAAFHALDIAAFAPYLAGYIALLACVHFARAWRWTYLLEPIGVRLPASRLLAVSTVGFMAVLALPARLGEFVRPALIRDRGKVSGARALGTIAVERIADGLMVSLLVFALLYARRGPDAPSWMMPVAYTSLGVFAAAMTFLVFALRNPERTVRFATRASLLRALSPRIADAVEAGLLRLISGFLVLDDRRNLAAFAAWTAAYWGANGLSVFVLARGFGLDLSVAGAFATMGLIAVGIILPNAPGLVGQFHAFTKIGLSLYLPSSVIDGAGMAFAIVLHGLQVIWYVGAGALALASPYVSFHEVFEKTKEAV